LKVVVACTVNGGCYITAGKEEAGSKSKYNLIPQKTNITGTRTHKDWTETQGLNTGTNALDGITRGCG